MSGEHVVKRSSEQLELQVDGADEGSFGAWVRSLPRSPFGRPGEFGTPARRSRRSRRRDAVRAYPGQRGADAERERR